MLTVEDFQLARRGNPEGFTVEDLLAPRRSPESGMDYSEFRDKKALRIAVSETSMRKGEAKISNRDQLRVIPETATAIRVNRKTGAISYYKNRKRYLYDKHGNLVTAYDWP